MNNPLLSIIVTTYNRPQLLPRAVESALGQTMEDLEVIVVDDGSPEPVNLPDHPRLKIIRLARNGGVAAARNIGARAAHGKWIAHLDDDDELLPHFAVVSLNALADTKLLKPVAVISGIDVLDKDGRLIRTRLPPTLPRGSHFGLEDIDSSESFFCKATVVVQRDVLLGIGGFDEAFTSLTYTEMFLRLNSVCSILGLAVVTYRQFLHEGPRITADKSRRQLNLHRLMSKHESIFRAHPEKFAGFVWQRALILYKLGRRREAFFSLWKATQLHPLRAIFIGTSFLRKRLRRYASFLSSSSKKKEALNA